MMIPPPELDGQLAVLLHQVSPAGDAAADS